MCAHSDPGIVYAQNFANDALKDAQAPWSTCCIKISRMLYRYGAVQAVGSVTLVIYTK